MTSQWKKKQNWLTFLSRHGFDLRLFLKVIVLEVFPVEKLILDFFSRVHYTTALRSLKFYEIFSWCIYKSLKLIILNFTSHSACKPFVSEEPGFMIKRLRVQTPPGMSSIVWEFWIFACGSSHLHMHVSSTLLLFLLLLFFVFFKVLIKKEKCWFLHTQEATSFVFSGNMSLMSWILCFMAMCHSCAEDRKIAGILFIFRI